MIDHGTGEVLVKDFIRGTWITVVKNCSREVALHLVSGSDVRQLRRRNHPDRIAIDNHGLGTVIAATRESDLGRFGLDVEFSALAPAMPEITTQPCPRCRKDESATCWHPEARS